MLKHTEFGAMEEKRSETVTVGVLLTPRHDGLRLWDTTMVRATGDLELAPEDISRMREVWYKK